MKKQFGQKKNKYREALKMESNRNVFLELYDSLDDGERETMISKIREITKRKILMASTDIDKMKEDLDDLLERNKIKNLLLKLNREGENPSQKEASPRLSQKRKMPLFQYLVPSQRREEVIGDLIETRWEMEQQGIVFWKIRLIMLGRMIIVFFALLNVRMEDLGRKQKAE